MAERNANGAGLSALGLFLAAGLVGAAYLGADAIRDVKSQYQTVEVKGYAERAIVSDFATWTGRFTTRSKDLADAYRVLERQRGDVLAFLKETGCRDEELEVSPVITEVLYRRTDQGMFTNDVEGYALSQEVTLSAGDIDRVARVSKESVNLVKRGIELWSNRPQYFYTKLGDLKIEMLGEATADARRRAEVLASNSGSTIGALRYARQGVFQITPALSTEVSDYGQNDTSARDKSIKSVVTIGYEIGR